MCKHTKVWNGDFIDTWKSYNSEEGFEAEWTTQDVNPICPFCQQSAAQPTLAPDRVTAPNAASTSTLAGEQSATPPHAAGEA